jgi:hypothetical protein
MHAPPNFVQSVHIDPPPPQALEEPPPWQVPRPSQQPSGQLAGLHEDPMHAPPDDPPFGRHLPPCAAQFEHWLPAWPHAV